MTADVLVVDAIVAGRVFSAGLVNVVDWLTEAAVVSSSAGKAPAAVEAVFSEELVFLHKKNDDLHLEVFDDVSSIGKSKSSTASSKDF